MFEKVGEEKETISGRRQRHIGPPSQLGLVKDFFLTRFELDGRRM